MAATGPECDVRELLEVRCARIDDALGWKLRHEASRLARADGGHPSVVLMAHFNRGKTVTIRETPGTIGLTSLHRRDRIIRLPTSNKSFVRERKRRNSRCFLASYLQTISGIFIPFALSVKFRWRFSIIESFFHSTRASFEFGAKIARKSGVPDNDSDP